MGVAEPTDTLELESTLRILFTRGSDPETWWSACEFWGHLGDMRKGSGDARGPRAGPHLLGASPTSAGAGIAPPLRELGDGDSGSCLHQIICGAFPRKGPQGCSSAVIMVNVSRLYCPGLSLCECLKITLKKLCEVSTWKKCVCMKL